MCPPIDVPAEHSHREEDISLSGHFGQQGATKHSLLNALHQAWNELEASPGFDEATVCGPEGC